MNTATIERVDDPWLLRTEITLRCEHAGRVRRFLDTEIVGASSWNDLIFVWAQREIAGIEASYAECRCWRERVESPNPACRCDPACWYDRLIAWLAPKEAE